MVAISHRACLSCAACFFLDYNPDPIHILLLLIHPGTLPKPPGEKSSKKKPWLAIALSATVLCFPTLQLSSPSSPIGLSSSNMAPMTVICLPQITVQALCTPRWKSSAPGVTDLSTRIGKKAPMVWFRENGCRPPSLTVTFSPALGKSGPRYQR